MLEEPFVTVGYAHMSKATADIIELLEKADDKFAWVVTDDARKAGAAIALVLGQESIGSEIVDNLNAAIHLRALLTNLFLVSEAARSREQE